jgi:hypothetical protein
VALKEDLLQQVVVQADETPLNVLKEEKQCYMWLYCSGADSPEAALPNVKKSPCTTIKTVARGCAPWTF